TAKPNLGGSRSGFLVFGPFPPWRSALYHLEVGGADRDRQLCCRALRRLGFERAGRTREFSASLMGRPHLAGRRGRRIAKGGAGGAYASTASAESRRGILTDGRE